MPIYVQFENKQREIMSPEIGPYDFVQLTYDILRVSIGDNEKDLALISSRGYWKLLNFPHWTHNMWTDVMIYEKVK